jgi:hypothetical protein
MKAIVLSVSLLAITACSSNLTPVREVGPGVYHVSYSERGKNSSWQKIRDQSYQAATAYCAQQGLVMQEEKMETHGARMWTSLESELRFRCVPRQ